jgi:hypothetical protein
VEQKFGEGMNIALNVLQKLAEKQNVQQEKN